MTTAGMRTRSYQFRGDAEINGFAYARTWGKQVTA
jgi:hypothetical protein